VRCRHLKSSNFPFIDENRIAIIGSVSTPCSSLLCYSFLTIIGPILWGHSGPLCHALSLSSSSSLSWTSMRRRRATVATPGEWRCKTGDVRRLAVANGPYIFQNSSCCIIVARYCRPGPVTATPWCCSVVGIFGQTFSVPYICAGESGV